MRELYIYKDAFTGDSMVSLGKGLSAPLSIKGFIAGQMQPKYNAIKKLKPNK